VGVAAALKQALEMKPEKRRDAASSAPANRQADILTWRDHFFQALEKTGAAAMPACLGFGLVSGAPIGMPFQATERGITKSYLRG